MKLVTKFNSLLEGEQSFDTAPKITFFILILGGIHTAFIVLFLWLRIWVMVDVNIISLLIYSISYFSKLKNNYKWLTILLYSEVMLHTLCATFTIGNKSGFHLYLIGLVPAVYYIAYNAKAKQQKLSAWKLSLLSLILYVIVKAIDNCHEPLYQLSTKQYFLLYYMNILITYIAVVYVMTLFATAVCMAEKKLKAINKKLKTLANTDPLTELSNRRGMEKRLEKAILEANENVSTFSIIIADIDDFKQLNDTYGHECGDFILIRIAEILKDQVRNKDFVCRWGGEEILILLSDCKIDSGATIAEKLRIIIEETEIEYDKEFVHFTMTFGVQEYIPGSTAEDIIRMADMKLYKGKKKGKNCVISQL